MDDELLSYYNRELAYLRKMGADFAEKHPKIAGRLRLDRDVVEDPHVSRLIESFAFLTARIRHKLDDSFPELTDALMGQLFPDYQAPIPSLSIVQLRLAPRRLEPRTVTAGEQLFTEAGDLGRCIYRTCFETRVYPLQVAAARFSALPFVAPQLPARGTTGAQAVLRLSLRAEPGVKLAELAPPSLRFYLSGQPQLSFRLYEYLLSRTVAIAIAGHPQDPEARFLSPRQLQPRGLDEQDSALPGDGRSGIAHRLLTEYFAFPEKFLFVELQQLADCWAGFDEGAELYFYFDQSHAELVQGVSEAAMLLGCTPIVNLFPQRLRNLHAADIGHETPLRADTSFDQCADIHTVLQLHAEDGSGQRIELQPFYGAHRSGADHPNPIYWHLRRETSHYHNGRVSRGSEVQVAFVDHTFATTEPDSDWVIGGEALCTNRDLPDHLPFGPDQPRLQFYQEGAGLRLRCITAPTPTLLPTLREASRWQLVTKLSLQHFSGPEGLDNLKATLQLYDFKQLPESRAIINGIVALRCRQSSARIAREGRASICQGSAIELELDELHYSGSGLYLFSAILAEFFASCCAINTFVQLTVHIRQRPGCAIHWPPRSGRQLLI